MALFNRVQRKTAITYNPQNLGIVICRYWHYAQILNYQFQRNANLSLLWQQQQFPIVIPFVLVSEELKCQCSLLVLHILWITLFVRVCVKMFWKPRHNKRTSQRRKKEVNYLTHGGDELHYPKYKHIERRFAMKREFSTVTWNWKHWMPAQKQRGRSTEN